MDRPSFMDQKPGPFLPSELVLAEGELGYLINALAKASKEHDRFITISISIGSHTVEPEITSE